jgi:hypothetical protein
VALGSVLAIGELALARCYGVVRKNDAKTHETHEVGPTGKIVGRTLPTASTASPARQAEGSGDAH